ncbi:hypothetical protein [Caldalkalibacillus mannanilyticus]|nr:hypothetical protein [Caldalkalibacillus mannanilyticus]
MMQKQLFKVMQKDWKTVFGKMQTKEQHIFLPFIPIHVECPKC